MTNPQHCSITGIHTPVQNQDWFQCRWCHKKVDGVTATVLSPQVKFVDTNALFKETVEFYLKKNYSLERCNEIAQQVVERYLQKNKTIPLEAEKVEP